MKVILLQDVKALGKKGQTVDVSDGYARNCILPKKLGVEATSKNLNDLKLQKAAKMADMEVIVSIKSGKDGRTFGSVSSKEIATAFKEQHGMEIDKKKIVLDEPIRSVGTTIVSVKLHKDVVGKLNVRVREA